MNIGRIAVAAMAGLPVAAAIALTGGPVANASTCLPTNGSQLHANSFADTHILGVVYATNVDYWFANGSVNWHKTIDGGAFNATHLDTTGAVPAGPGDTVQIPGANPNEATSEDQNPGLPINVTVCGR